MTVAYFRTDAPKSTSKNLNSKSKQNGSLKTQSNEKPYEWSKKERERDQIVGLRKINELGKDKAGKDTEMLVCEKKSHL